MKEEVMPTANLEESIPSTPLDPAVISMEKGENGDKNRKKLVFGKETTTSTAQVPALKKANKPVLEKLKDLEDASGEIRISPRPKDKKGPMHASGYYPGEYIVYPTHGVGQITMIEEQEIAGCRMELFVIDFVKDKMVLKVPLAKILKGSIRKIGDSLLFERALSALNGRVRTKRAMWSRRAQEYEMKINSGDLISLTEVVRDLYRSETQPDQSYSERQIYELALDRMIREFAAAYHASEGEIRSILESYLRKGQNKKVGTKSKSAKKPTSSSSDQEGVVGDEASSIEEAA